MTFHVKNGLYNPTSILCAFFGLLCLLGSVAGQPIEPAVVQIPNSPIDLDSVDHHLYVGSAAAPLEDVYAIEAIYSYTGYQIHANTNSVLQYGDSSWFNDDGLGEGTVFFDTIKREITVNLTRPVSDPRTGHGFVCMVPDIIVVIEEIGKRNISSLQLKHLKWKFSPQMKALSLARGKGIAWDEPYEVCEILTLDGKMLKRSANGDWTSLGVEYLPVGYYILRWKNDQRWNLCKLRVY